VENVTKEYIYLNCGICTSNEMNPEKSAGICDVMGSSWNTRSYC